MMTGMFGLGLVLILLVIGLPVLDVVLLASGSAGLLNNRVNNPTSSSEIRSSISSQAKTDTPVLDPTRYCFHCGAGLKDGWTNCPECGAQIQ
jgi:zinc-ribbon domain